MWSSRRANEDNYYCSRIETLDVDDLSETEVLIDTSGSIDNKFISYFLSELITLLKTSKIKVGCFDTQFYGFTEITAKNMKNLKLKGGGGTDFDVAVNAFSKSAQNRIVFTDGEASMPNKKVSAIWIVVGDRQINPNGGKVINIKESQLRELKAFSLKQEELIR